MSTASLHIDPAKIAAKRITGIMTKHGSITGKNLTAIARTIRDEMTRPEDFGDTEVEQIDVIIGVLKWRLNKRVYKKTDLGRNRIELSHGCNAPRQKRGKGPRRKSGSRPNSRVRAMA